MRSCTVIVRVFFLILFIVFSVGGGEGGKRRKKEGSRFVGGSVLRSVSGGRSGERLISGVAHLGQVGAEPLRCRFGLQTSDRPDNRRLGNALLLGWARS